MFKCNRCAAQRKTRASSVVCPVCKTGELIFDATLGGGGGGGGSGGSQGEMVVRESPPAVLLCDHCHKVFVNPVSMPECQHKFCRSCVMDEPLPADVGEWELQVVLLDPVNRTVKCNIDPEADTGKMLKQKVVGLMPHVLQRSMSLTAMYMGTSVALDDKLLLSTQKGVEPGASISLEILQREAATGLRCPVCRSQVVPPGGDTLHGVSINKGLKEMADEYRQLSRAMGSSGHW